MISIKIFIVFAVATFHFAIVPWREYSDFLMAYAELCQRFFKHRQRFLLAVSHFIGKLKSVVCLYALDRIRNFLDNMFEKLCGGVGAVFLEGFQISKTAVFINKISSAAFPTRQTPGTNFTSI